MLQRLKFCISRGGGEHTFTRDLNLSPAATCRAYAALKHVKSSWPGRLTAEGQRLLAILREEVQEILEISVDDARELEVVQVQPEAMSRQQVEDHGVECLRNAIIGPRNGDRQYRAAVQAIAALGAKVAEEVAYGRS